VNAPVVGWSGGLRDAAPATAGAAISANPNPANKPTGASPRSTDSGILLVSTLRSA